MKRAIEPDPTGVENDFTDEIPNLLADEGYEVLARRFLQERNNDAIDKEIWMYRVQFSL